MVARVCVQNVCFTDLSLQSERLRYQLFSVKIGDLDSSQLPLCQDTLMLYAMLANYQACIWKKVSKTRNRHH